MKRIVIALAVAAVLAGGIVVAWNIMDNSSVATASGADHTVPRSEVEKLAKENFGIPFVQGGPQSVSCPRGLHAKVEDTVSCTAVFKGRSRTMLISVTGVKGDRVSFDYGVLK
ncbi:protein of unknown function [Streptomyces sp. DvalAA-14]|uniref:DUF4333 domain-containing protein n=1 Tax=unclassified Streptomyces TaxID=2593676 RepID=UPI00081B7F7D|nr:MULTISPECIES: DUF4333 domain-containing protein [unclassified Streptomyces]MYS21134.1 DUF4333 domain-containing protein [Streptomyces sp. SID4948]SCD85030.1 protein of unknown function [Streptomyces sp. DvalAA-14]